LPTAFFTDGVQIRGVFLAPEAFWICRRYLSPFFLIFFPPGAHPYSSSENLLSSVERANVFFISSPGASIQCCSRAAIVAPWRFAETGTLAPTLDLPSWGFCWRLFQLLFGFPAHQPRPFSTRPISDRNSHHYCWRLTPPSWPNL